MPLAHVKPSLQPVARHLELELQASQFLGQALHCLLLLSTTKPAPQGTHFLPLNPMPAMQAEQTPELALHEAQPAEHGTQAPLGLGYQACPLGSGTQAVHCAEGGMGWMGERWQGKARTAHRAPQDVPCRAGRTPKAAARTFLFLHAAQEPG